MGGVNYQLPSKKWRRSLLPETEDDCSGRSNSDNREGIDGAIHACRGKTRFSTEGLDDVGAILGEAIPGPCSFSNGRISWVFEDNYRYKHCLKGLVLLHS